MNPNEMPNWMFSEKRKQLTQLMKMKAPKTEMKTLSRRPDRTKSQFKLMADQPNQTGNRTLVSKFASLLMAGTALLLSNVAQADPPTTNTFTTAGAGTWSCPMGVNLIQVEVWGGGGGGGGAWKNGKNAGGGGGGGGAYARFNAYGVTPNTGYAFSVGAGGSGGIDNSGGNTASTPGTDSWFLNNSTLDAFGGAGGTNATGTSAVANGAGGSAAGIGTTGDASYAGGNGAASAGNPPSAGGGGGSGGYSHAGSPATGSTGGAAVTGSGAGGNGASPSTTFQSGFTPGGGGGGSRDTSGSGSTGGAGGSGQVQFTFYPTPTSQSSAVAFSGISSSGLTISWTRGNGGNCIVLVNTNSAVNAAPANGAVYTASATYGSGSQLGAGNYVVYQGTGNSVAVSGLAASTSCQVAVFEFSGLGSPLAEYLTNSPATGSQATLGEPTPTVASPTKSALSLASVTLGATVTTNNGYAITDYGILWGTSQNLAGSGTKVHAGSSIVAFPTPFTMNVSGLPVGTNIYYCGYATTSAGTGYSSSDSFVYFAQLGWSATNGTWDINDPTNLIWADAVSGPDYYQDGDLVVFGDAGGGMVTLNSTVNPTSLLVGNNVSAYTITGTGTIAGAISLIKLGTNSLTLATPNTYTGGTTNSAGTLILGNAASLGAGMLTMNGGNLDSSSADLVNTNNNPQAWNADFTFAGSQSLNLGSGSVTLGASRQVTVSASTLTIGGIISGAHLGLTQTGNGTLVLGTNNTYSGGTTVNGGVLILTNKISGAPGQIIGSLTVNSGAEAQSGDYWSLGYGSGYVTNIVLNGGTLTFTGGNSYPNDTGFAGTNLTLNGATVQANGGGSGFDFYSGSGANQTTYVNVMPNPIASVISCQTDLRLGSSGSLVFNVIGYGNGNDLLVSGSIVQAIAGKVGGAIIKSGAGVMTLSASNSTTSSITVNAGALLINGLVSSSSLTVSDNATLGGSNGVIFGPVDVQAGGTFAPEGVLTINSDLTLEDGSTTVVPINAAASTNAVVNAINNLSYSGTLVISNLAGTPVGGQQFQLFNASAPANNFTAISGTPGTGLTYSFNPTTGVLSVLGGTPTPTNIMASLSSGNLVLTWPNGQGWNLQAQTNTLAIGLGTNWVNVSGATSPFTNVMDPANGSVFYRLTYP